jgi:poly-gamma-glutamate synthesis protein (capsule biosynthesis protein)
VKESARVHGAGAPHGGYAWLWAPVADLLGQPDLTFANLESPIAPDAARDVRQFHFNAPAEAALALRDAGVDLVAVANNHAFDQGRAGFEETLRRLEASGLRALGAGPSGAEAGPVRVEAGGLSLAFLSWAYAFNQDGNECPPTAPPPPCLRASILVRDRALEEVRAAAASADAVVVSLHWGVEYARQPRAEDVEFAHRLADAGALVILGHHPHVLQPVEIYPRADGRVAVIAYSLGNFISNQERRYVHGVTGAVGAARDGALLRVALARRDYGRGVERVEVEGADWLALWTENDTAEIDPRREPGRTPAIRVVSIDRALAEVRAEMAGIPDPVPPEAAGRFIRLRQREALYLARRAAVGSVLGEELARTLSDAEIAPPPLALSDASR